MMSGKLVAYSSELGGNTQRLTALLMHGSTRMKLDGALITTRCTTPEVPIETVTSMRPLVR